MSANDQNALKRILATQNGPGTGGVAEYCNQMNQLSGNSGNVNAGLATVCTSNQSSCSGLANSLIAKYNGLVSNCGNCESRAIYQSTLNVAQQIQSNCNQLQVRSVNLVNQGMSGAGSNGYAQYCQQLASANPNAIPPLANNPLNGSSALATLSAADCVKNPNTAACQALKESQQRSGEAGFAIDEKKEEKFNLSANDGYDGSGLATSPQTPAQQAAKINPISNNSGGAIPGAGGGTATASLQPQSKGQTSPGSPGYSTDVFQGMNPGGYSQPVYPDRGDRGEGSPYGGRGLAGQDGDKSMVGMDLSQFLPGGSRDPKRLVGGIGRGSGIHAKEEDIWRVISLKINEKCRLGVLWSCR